MKNFKFISTLMFCFAFLFMQGQDLIKDTQNGIKSSNVALKTTDNANAIFKNIDVISKTEKFTPSTLFKINSNKRELTSRYKNTVSGAVFLDLSKSDLTKINQQKPKNVSFSLPVNENNSIELMLTESNFKTEDFIVRTADGKLFDYKKEGGLFYQGVVKDDPNSTVALSIFNNSIRGIISDKDGNYVLGAIDTEHNKKVNTYVTNSNKYVLFNDYNLTTENDFMCANDASVESKAKATINNISKRNIANSNESNLSQVDKYIPIYLECDYSSFTDLFDNSTGSAYNFLTSLFNETSIIYATEDVNIKLSELYIVNSTSAQNSTLGNEVSWANSNISSSNGWPTRTGKKSPPQEILDIFTHYIQDNFNGRLAHLVYTINTYSGTPYSVAYANRSYVGSPAICLDYQSVGVGPTAASSFTPYVDAFPNFSRDVFVFAHELGHNFGLKHGYQCVWSLSNNVADIMLDSGSTGLELDNCSESWDPSSQPSCGHLNFPPAIMSSCQDHPLSNGFGRLPGTVLRNNYNAPCTSTYSDITTSTTSGDLDCRGDIDIFTDFTWLNSLVDPNDCGGEKISVWTKGTSSYWKYFYIQDDVSKKLYYSSGSSNYYYLAQDFGTSTYYLNYYLSNGARNIANWSCDCCVIDISNFETDFGIWNDGGANCWRRGDTYTDNNTNNDFAGTGRVGALLRWNTGTSLMTTDALDLENFDEVNVGFSFFGHSMEGNEKFRLQISVDGGANYYGVKEWTFKTTATPDDVDQYNVTNSDNYNSNVHSNVRYAADVKISTYNLSSNTKFRFRSYSHKWDYVILDNIVISTCDASGDGTLARMGEVDAEDLRIETNDIISLYPNPAEDVLNINIKGMEFSSIDEELDFEIYSFDGRMIKKGTMNNAGNFRIDINQLAANQTYLIKVQTADGEVFTDKFVKN